MDLRTILNAVTVVPASGTAQTLAASTVTGEDPVYDLTLTADCTLTLAAAASGRQQSITLYARQDATGGRALALPGGLLWPAATPPVLSTAAGKVDVLRFTTLDGSTWFGCTIALNLAAVVVIEQPARIEHDGTPQAGEPLLGVDPVVTGASVVSRRWLLGSTVLATVNAYTPGAAGLFRFEALGLGAVVLSSAQVNVAAATITPTPTPPGALATKAIAGNNLDYITPNTVERPFLDRMKMSSAWEYSDGSGGGVLPAQYLDADGWPTGVPPGTIELKCYAPSSYADETVATRDFNVNFPGGNGAILGSSAHTQLQPGATPTRAVLRDLATDPAGNGAIVVAFDVSKITSFATFRPTIVRVDQQALFDSGEIWNPLFIEKTQENDILRFMNLTAINENERGGGGWNDRPKVTNRSFGIRKQDGGIPYEWQIALCNKLGVSGWFHVPHLATPAFWLALAELLRDTLNTSLDAYVELTNEKWNFLFPQTSYYYNKLKYPPGSVDGNGQSNAGQVIPGSAPNFPDVPGWIQTEYSSYFAAKMALLFDKVFRAAGQRNRLHNQMGVQTQGGLSVFDRVLTGALWAGDENLPASGVTSLNEVFDDFAIARYIGTFSSNDPGDIQKINDNFLVPTGDAPFVWAIESFRNGGKGLTTEVGNTLLRLNADTEAWQQKAIEQGVGLTMYEGCINVLVYDGWSALGAGKPAAMLAKSLQLMARPELRAFQKDTLDAAADRGVHAGCTYKLTARAGYGESGTFGMFTSIDAPLNGSAKFLGQRDYLAARKDRLSLGTLTAAVNNPAAYVGVPVPMVVTARGGDGPPYTMTLLSGTLPAGRSIEGLHVGGTYTTEQTTVSAVLRVADRTGGPGHYVDVPVTQTVGPAQNGYRYFRLEGITNGAIEAGVANHRTALGEWELLDAQGVVIPWPSGTTFTTSDGIEGQFGPASFPAAVGDGDRGTFFTCPDGTTPGYAGQMRVYAALPEGTKVRPASWRFKSAADGNFEWAPVRFRGYATNTVGQLKAEGAGTLICDRSGAVSPGANPANNPLGYGPGPNGGVTFACVYP